MDRPRLVLSPSDFITGGKKKHLRHRSCSFTSFKHAATSLKGDVLDSRVIISPSALKKIKRWQKRTAGPRRPSWAAQFYMLMWLRLFSIRAPAERWTRQFRRWFEGLSASQIQHVFRADYKRGAGSNHAEVVRRAHNIQISVTRARAHYFYDNLLFWFTLAGLLAAVKEENKNHLQAPPTQEQTDVISERKRGKRAR